MTVLVDTSVWSLAFRRKGPADHRAVRRLADLLDRGEPVAITGLILQEILQAYRQERTAARIARFLEPVPLLGLERDDYAAAARLKRRCAARGIAATTADCQIAQAAIAHRCSLLSADLDFERIAGVCDLRLE